MPSGTCWLCDNELTPTKEHIIPESMGGKKTVHGFICRNCNSRTGHDWDVATPEFESWKFQLDPSLSINPRRERPIRGRMAGTGLNVFIGSGVQIRLGHNSPTKTGGEDGQLAYQFTSDPDHVDELFDSVNTLLRRRGRAEWTRGEFDARVEHRVTEQPLVNFTLQMNIPGYYRSLVKTSMAMAFSLGIDPLDCDNAIGYMRDETMNEEGVVVLPGTSLQGIMDDWTNYHAATVFGFPDARKLIAEVLYFGSVAGLVTLSNSYDGPKIIAGHAVNLKTGEYTDADLDLPNLALSARTGIELLKARVGQFRSPLVLEVLRDLNETATEAQ